MNFEGLEQFRYECTKQVMESMAALAADTQAPVEERIKAAKVVDAMSDSIIKAYLLTNAQHTNEKGLKTADKLINQMEKLDGKNPDEE
jgi:hypothetical protein